MSVKKKTQPTKADDAGKREVPSGVKLVRTFEGHTDAINSVTFDTQGDTLASGCSDGTVKLWDSASGKLLHTITGHKEYVVSVTFNPQGGVLASGSNDGKIKLWDTRTGKELQTLNGHRDRVWSVAFSPQGGVLASGSYDQTVKLWDADSGKLLHTLDHQSWVWSVAFDPQNGTVASGCNDGTVNLWDSRSGKLLRTLEGHNSYVYSVAFDFESRTLASASSDKTVKLWDWRGGKLLRTLEGHTASVDGVAFSPNGRLLASVSRDDTIRLWSCETWETVAVVPEPKFPSEMNHAVAFHPNLPLLAVSGTSPDTSLSGRSRLIHLWELDLDGPKVMSAQAIHHTTGKIVLVGDHSVGKSALGYRMIHGQFKEQASTHGQRFWVFPALGSRRADGTDCEAILWDLAGQPDYRLVHALFVDDADLALVLFDASDLHDPLHGVRFWLKQLQTGQDRCPVILVAAQSDRGTSTLTPQELESFCRRHSIAGPVTTSAATGAGLADLIAKMKSMIPWDDKPATVTTTTFKRIKDYVLGQKESDTESSGGAIVTSEELRTRLETTDAEWGFTDTEMMTAVGHLENYGYVKRLRTSKGEERILLEPERLNNLASSFVLAARRHQKGLGALEEDRLLSGGYVFSELASLSEEERDVLVDAAALLFLKHNVCFRETNPLRRERYLVFPELINLKRPLEEQKPVEDGVAYTVSGPTENVFASLVVLLGYSHTFTHTSQWFNNARYEVGGGLACGFRQEAERDDELDFVLCFGPDVGQPVRTLFQGLFESFLARRNLTVRRYEPVPCSNSDCRQLLDRAVVRRRLNDEKTFAFCDECGEKLILPKMVEPIQLTRDLEIQIEQQRRAAKQRTRFEQAVFQVQTYVAEQGVTSPECFISYAWGVPEHERWVEKRLATDLRKAGIGVVLDRWENARVGASVSRFVARIEKCERIIVVGTPLYRLKYENKDTKTGYVVAAEVDMIDTRLLGTEAQKESVLPLLLNGEKKSSLPPLLHGRVYADFRDESAYFATAFDLILSLYRIPADGRPVADLRESLCEQETR